MEWRQASRCRPRTIAEVDSDEVFFPRHELLQHQRQRSDFLPPKQSSPLSRQTSPSSACAARTRLLSIHKPCPPTLCGRPHLTAHHVLLHCLPVKLVHLGIDVLFKRSIGGGSLEFNQRDTRSRCGLTHNVDIEKVVGLRLDVVQCTVKEDGVEDGAKG